MNNKPTSRRANIVVQELEKEFLIYDSRINKAFCLNETSRLVFQLADGTRTISQITELMSVRLKTKLSEDLVRLALDGLEKNNLLENIDGSTYFFAGSTRREIIRNVGLASLVTLPLITGIIAPSAANAASNCAANGTVCTPSNNTRSNCCNSNQRCFNSTCTTCSAAPARLASCQSAGCCNLRSDRNLCCSGIYNETLIGGDYQCECA